jgi:hypothetical protein
MAAATSLATLVTVDKRKSWRHANERDLEEAMSDLGNAMVAHLASYSRKRLPPCDLRAVAAKLAPGFSEEARGTMAARWFFTWFEVRLGRADAERVAMSEQLADLSRDCRRRYLRLWRLVKRSATVSDATAMVIALHRLRCLDPPFVVTEAPTFSMRGSPGQRVAAGPRKATAPPVRVLAQNRRAWPYAIAPHMFDAGVMRAA